MIGKIIEITFSKFWGLMSFETSHINHLYKKALIMLGL